MQCNAMQRNATQCNAMHAIFIYLYLYIIIYTYIYIYRSIYLCIYSFIFSLSNYESQLAGSLLSANKVSIRGSGGRACPSPPKSRYYLGGRVCFGNVFPGHVPCGKRVTVGYRFPLGPHFGEPFGVLGRGADVCEKGGRSASTDRKGKGKGAFCHCCRCWWRKDKSRPARGSLLGACPSPPKSRYYLGGRVGFGSVFPGRFTGRVLYCIIWPYIWIIYTHVYDYPHIQEVHACHHSICNFLL